MRTYYIQYATDFHLLAALASIKDLGKIGKLVIVGPETVMSRAVATRFNADTWVAAPAGVRLSLRRVLVGVIKSEHRKSSVIISPFVFPNYVFQRLLDNRELVTSIIRTDEGVGTYASIRHFYKSMRAESPLGNAGYLMLRAILKRGSMLFTKHSRICAESYLFNNSGELDRDKLDNFKRLVNDIGLSQGLKGRTIFVSQPGGQNLFKSDNEYASFIRSACGVLHKKSVVIKKHPSDFFDYKRHGFEVFQGPPLELCDTRGSVVFGFSSTALLIEKAIEPSAQVYFVNISGEGPVVKNLSPFVQKLFFRHLEELFVPPDSYSLT